MDDVQYDKRFTNRNRILTPQGPIFLTVPINKQHKFSVNNTVAINNELAWREDHWKKMYMCYANAKFFPLYRSYFENLYKSKWDLLIELDYETLVTLMKWLEIDVPVIKESELGIKEVSGTERLVEVCKKIGADCYVSGRGGRNYMDEKLFERSGIRLEYQAYSATPYSQKFTQEFVPDLSVVDLIFNMGEKSRSIIDKSGKAENPSPSLDPSRVEYVSSTERS